MRLALPTLLAIAIAAVGCGGTQSTPGGADGRVEAGRALYDRYCALCHGDEAQGYAADNATSLRSPQLLGTATDRFLREAVVRGRPGTPMSAWGEAHGGPLAADDVDALVAFMRSLQTGPTIDVHGIEVAGDAERGAGMFARACAGCHGDRGQGGDGVTLDNPVFHDTASDGFIRHAITHGRSGTAMPAYGDALEDQVIDDLVVFIRTLRRADEESGPALEGPAEDVINPGGPHPDFTLREGMYVPADEVKAALDAGARIVLLDARPTSDYQLSHIPGAVSVPFYAVDDVADRLPRDDTWVVAYCGCPHAASGRVIEALRERGFRRTAVLDEGLGVWTERGYPIARPTDAP